MRLLEALANAFINTFGITQPTERTRRQASWFIAGLLVFALAAAGTALVVVWQALRR